MVAMSNTSTSRSPLRRLAGRIGFRHIAHHAADAAEQRVEQRQRVHAEIVERAPAVDRLVALLERRFGVGQEILVHLDADMVDRADHALVEQLPDVTDCRILDVVVAEHGAALPEARACGQHLLGFGELGRHRLLAPDMLAGGERGARHLQMELVRRGDRDDVDLGVGDHALPVARRLLEAELGGLAVRQLVVGLAEMDEAYVGNVAEDGAAPSSRPARGPCP